MWDALFGLIAAALEPLWQTPVALAAALGLAQAGTTLFGLFLFVAALEVLRSSTGALVHGARLVAVGAAAIVAASIVYGDFLAPPAKAAYSLIATLLPETRPGATLFATLGVATAGAAYGAAKKSNAAKTMTSFKFAAGRSRPPRAQVATAGATARISEPGGMLMLDPAGRLQLRQLIHNPKKATTKAVRTARVIAPAAHSPSGGRTWS